MLQGDTVDPGGLGQLSPKNHMNKFHSILRYAESPRGFTEIKQVSAHSIRVCRGTNAWDTFVLRVEHPYIVGKSEKSLNEGESTFHAGKTMLLIAAAN